MIFKEKTKIFCIGRNKTGTTSLEQALKDFGYKMGSQAKAEMLISHYAKADWKPIIKFCKTAEAFQDAPFSYPYTWLILHHYYPDAKFILTIRDPEAWYKSFTRYHSKIFTGGTRVPTKEDLMKRDYRYKGFAWDVKRAVFKTPENDLYNKEIFIENYNTHNNAVRHFFKDKPNFLEIDLSEEDSYLRLCKFLDKKPLYEKFPHLNIT